MELPSPKELKNRFPITPQQVTFIAQSRQAAKNILSKKDTRLAIVVGPCSIHDIDAALDYAAHLKALLEKVSRTCFLIMRVYTEKPRTIAGWKGLLYDPYLDGSHNIQIGLQWTRELLLQLASMQIPVASEFVDPLAALYFDDLITWGFIGARTSASQPHRQLASSLQIPIGFKNGIDGSIDQAIYGVIAASLPHAFMHVNNEGKLCAYQSQGNPSAHIVLRGSMFSSNFDEGSINSALQQLRRANVLPRLLVDCAHGNCQKQFEKQKDVFYSVLEQIQAGNKDIFGLMLESHLHAGNQLFSNDPSSLKYAVSITDPCIDWSVTEELISAADLLLSSSVYSLSS